MQRVMIIGQPGSGKSTLARMLGRQTGLPVVHLDQIHWQPGWVARENAEKTRMCAEVHARDAWIFEGGHSATWPERLARCDTLIWLDVPLLIRVWRVIRRTWRDYGRSRPDLPSDCPERFDPAFYHFIWQTRKRARDSMQHLFDQAPQEKTCIRLTSRRDVDHFLSRLS